MGIGLLLSLLKNKALVYVIIAVIAIIIVAGGWVLYFQETQVTQSLQTDLDLLRAPPDTMEIQGDVKDSVRVDTLYTESSNDWDAIAKQVASLTDSLRGQDDSIGNMQSYIQSLKELLRAGVKADEVKIKETHSGVVEMDTTITGKVVFSGKVWYPSGLSQLVFKFSPLPKAKRKLFSGGIGVGYHTIDSPFVIIDLSIKRFGAGFYAEADDKFGGYLRINF